MPRLQRHLLTYPDPIPSSNSNARHKIRSRFPSMQTMSIGNIFVPLLFRETIISFPICAGAQMGIAQPREACPAWFPGAKRRQGRRKFTAMGKRYSFYSFSKETNTRFIPHMYALPRGKTQINPTSGEAKYSFSVRFFPKTNTLTLRYNKRIMEEEK
jgi:hypothetical protein